jgi:cell division septal protein FtsQ
MKRVRDFHEQSWNNPFFARTGGAPRFAVLRLIGGFAGTALIVYVFAYSPLLRLRHVTVSGAATIAPLRIQMVAAQDLGGYEYFVIPKDHYFAVSAIGVKNFIMTQFPDLLAVDVKKHFGRLEVIVTERQPAYRLIIGDRSYLLDQEGKGLREGAAGEGDALIALSADNAIFAAGKPMIQPEWLQTVNDLHKYFATLTGVRDQLYKIDPINDDIEVVTVEGWSAIFDPQTDISDQLKTLSSALVGKFNPSSRKKLLYIDARFGDKIFYKANQ